MAYIVALASQDEIDEAVMNGYIVDVNQPGKFELLSDDVEEGLFEAMVFVDAGLNDLLMNRLSTYAFRHEILEGIE